MCKHCDEIEKAEVGGKLLNKTRKGTPNKFVMEYEREFRKEFAVTLGKISSGLAKAAIKASK